MAKLSDTLKETLSAFSFDANKLQEITPSLHKLIADTMNVNGYPHHIIPLVSLIHWMINEIHGLGFPKGELMELLLSAVDYYYDNELPTDIKIDKSKVN